MIINTTTKLVAAVEATLGWGTVQNNIKFHIGDINNPNFKVYLIISNKNKWFMMVKKDNSLRKHKYKYGKIACKIKFHQYFWQQQEHELGWGQKLTYILNFST